MTVCLSPKLDSYGAKELVTAVVVKLSPDNSGQTGNLELYWTTKSVASPLLAMKAPLADLISDGGRTARMLAGSVRSAAA